jgi:hypothetical protein
MYLVFFLIQQHISIEKEFIIVKIPPVVMIDKVAKRKDIAQKFVVIQKYTIFQEREKTWTSLGRPAIVHGMFFENMKRSKFCGHNMLIERVFVTMLSSNTRISF